MRSPLPQFPGVTFRYTPYEVTADTGEGGEPAVLITGMPVWSVWLTDLTGDGLPEFCAALSMGSGIVDNRVVIYDYAGGASYTLEVERHSDVLDVPLDSPVLQQIQAIYRQMGVETRVESTFGGCDATWLCANGIRALNTGTGMANVHGTGEHIAIKDLETTTRMVEALMAITQG